MLDTTPTSAGVDAPTFTTLRRVRFPGLEFRKAALTQAGRILKREGPDAALLYLEDKGETAPTNARPPAKCNIVACSRPLAEWPIAVVSHAIQEAIYRLRLDDFTLLEQGFKKTGPARQFILHRLGLRADGIHVQALNQIIPNALSTYRGVIVKVDNRNEKAAKKRSKANERREAEGLEPEPAAAAKSATNADGYLLEPPGVNPTILCYQQISPRAVLHTKGIAGVPERFASYVRDSHAPLRVTDEKRKRLAIPPGEPGHVPSWQYPLLSRKKGRRVRAWYADACNKPKRVRRPESPERTRARELARDRDALLTMIKIGSDWLLLDARGLLRNVVWRGLATEGLSLQGLLDMFSGDPVIDYARGVVTFLYKEGVVPIRKRTTTPTKKAPALIEKLVAEHETIGMVTIDLGQTNPVAARVSRVGDNLKDPEFVSQLALPDELLRMWGSYRSASDQLEATLKREAIAALPDEHQAEIARVDACGPAECRALLAERLQVDLSDLLWQGMSSGTYHVAERVLRDRPDLSDLVHFVNKKKGRLMRTDHNVYKWVRPKVVVETRDLLNTTLWVLKRSSAEYARLSLRKRELSRRCSNWIVRETRRITGCQHVVVACEDLNVGFFHGSGRRDVGWDQFFVSKRENRWLIQALHLSLTDLAPHQGIVVVEANPARTSITCPQCGHCDRKNRDGEAFRCLGCGVKLHADFEVATMNLERVTLTGQGMPKPARESRGCFKKSRTARSTRKPSDVKDVPLTENSLSNVQVDGMAAE